MNLANILVPFIMAVSPDSAKNYDKTYDSGWGKSHYMTNGKTTFIDFKMSIFVPCIPDYYSIFVDPENKVYLQNNGKPDTIPEGISDFITHMRNIIENPIYEMGTDTLPLFVDGKTKMMIVKRGCSPDSSERIVSARCVKGRIGGCLEKMTFISKNKIKYPKEIVTKNYIVGSVSFKRVKGSRKP